jgi:hypothetical protein
MPPQGLDRCAICCAHALISLRSGVGAWLQGWPHDRARPSLARSSVPMEYPKRSRYKYAKTRYRVRDWAEYRAGFRKRGDLTVWLSDAALHAWRAPVTGNWQPAYLREHRRRGRTDVRHGLPTSASPDRGLPPWPSRALPSGVIPARTDSEWMHSSRAGSLGTRVLPGMPESPE